MNKLKHKIDKIPLGQLLLLIAIMAYLISSNSCANQGVGPGGGPRDSIPPTILNSIPVPFQTNFEGKEIHLTFDEYVVADNLTSKLVVSPPLAEKTTIKTKGKSIVVKFNEDLIPSRTYSIDFKDGIKDYNEGNKLEGFRMLFSTYDHIDTLRISGYLLDAFTHAPVENAMASLYSVKEDSFFTSLRPDFIAKADDQGYFLFDNLPEGSFRLYGLVDGDNNLLFSQETELIAFTDTMITPSAQFIHKPDTIIENEDTLISNGFTKYYPEPVYALLFQEDYYNQYLVSSTRESEDKILLNFNESLTDSFKFSLIDIDQKPSNWSYVEYGQNRDSVNIWITDTLISGIDSLYLKVEYTLTDSAGIYITQIDTLNLFYFDKETTKTKKHKKSEEQEKAPALFSFNTNLMANNFDLNKPILITAPIPINKLDKSVIKLEKTLTDSTSEAVDFKLEALDGSKRKFKISYQPQEASTYHFSIDSAYTYSLNGIPNDGFSSTFKTQKADYYGTAIFELEGYNGIGIVQLLKNNDKEEVVKTVKIKPGDKKAVFDFLKPDKYKIKLIADLNNNGKWDTGDIEKNIQPEVVYYFPKIINVKSNWELKENWGISSEMDGPKEITDPDKKEEKEKPARQP